LSKKSTNIDKPELQFLFVLLPVLYYYRKYKEKEMKRMPSAVVRKPLERITKYHRLNHDTLDVKIRDSGFTNAAVAEALGISEEYVRKLRKKDANIHIKLLSQIMELFDVSYQELTVVCTVESDNG
jgi:DNA-binding Xre family transcriptional regulator